MHNITLTQDDHITFQLYEASTDPSKIRSRWRSLLILISLALIVAIHGYLQNSEVAIYYGLFWIALVLCFGKTYLRWRHKMHYSKHVKNYLKGVPEEINQIEIANDHIQIINRAGQSSIKISELTSVNEIQTHYFLKLSTGNAYIVPKTNYALNEAIDKMIKDHDVPHIAALNWKW